MRSSQPALSYPQSGETSASDLQGQLGASTHLGLETIDYDLREAIQQIAVEIRRRRLEAPAIFLLELARPWGSFWFSAGAMSRPLGSLLFGVERFDRLVALFSQPEHLESLMVEIERGANLQHNERQATSRDLTPDADYGP